MHLRIIALILICHLCCLTAGAQSFSSTTANTAIKKMAALLRDHYVHKEKGDTLALRLLAAHKAGQFATAKSWKDLEQLTTSYLQEISHDGHLYVKNDPATSKQLLAAKAIPADTTGTAARKLSASEDLFFYGPEAAARNYGFESVRVTPDNVGHLQLSAINISRKSLPTLYAAMRFVANTRALVIDLRNNGGGGSDTGAVFESYFLPPAMPLLVFTGRTGIQSADSTVSWLKEAPYKQPVFILVNGRTASAAEAFTFVLQKTGRALVIGERSAGGANMNVWFPVNDELLISISQMAPVWPGTTDSWEQKGIQPDCIATTPAEIDACIHARIGKPRYRPR
ncbi:S41 family peptidase [Chitinophaga rhizophila]|uniref:S41 family peptidase n=1 Tax=Chitinophaga rhizophila TaxID=2866212 RepID=A0ABS7GAT3_9BACT|nr:S41 family peptidase [Chitinophaga rhizophila]MBW8683924.1 S41 family peptidase [Chitinophaga rhizophila]